MDFFHSSKRELGTCLLILQPSIMFNGSFQSKMQEMRLLGFQYPQLQCRMYELGIWTVINLLDGTWEKITAT